MNLVPLAFLMGQLAASPHHPLLNVWPSGPPDGWTRADHETSEKDVKANFLIIHNVSTPTLEIFKAAHPIPDAPTVIVCPGGGYSIEAIEHEGWEIADRLNKAGINAAVLKYRIPNRDTDHILALAPLQDAQRSIRLLRSHAAEYGFDPTRVGIMGFSAGGHLAAYTSNTLAPAYSAIDAVDAANFRPAFTVLIYPAYLDTAGKPTLTQDFQTTKETPPTFIAQTMDDPYVQSSFAYALACKAVGIPAELHIWPKGGHGYGLRSKEPGLREWPDLLIEWLRRR